MLQQPPTALAGAPSPRLPRLEGHARSWDFGNNCCCPKQLGEGGGVGCVTQAHGLPRPRAILLLGCTQEPAAPREDAATAVVGRAGALEGCAPIQRGECCGNGMLCIYPAPFHRARLGWGQAVPPGLCPQALGRQGGLADSPPPRALGRGQEACCGAGCLVQRLVLLLEVLAHKIPFSPCLMKRPWACFPPPWGPAPAQPGGPSLSWEVC